MDKLTDHFHQSALSQRQIIVPKYIENLNAVARAHGLQVSEPRITHEQQSYGIVKTKEYLAVDWRGSGAQFRSLGWILHSWTFPVASVRGPGCKRLEAKWGLRGYVCVAEDETDVVFDVNCGDVPLGSSWADGVETLSYNEYVEYHGTAAALIGAGIANEQQLTGKKQRKSNGSSPAEPSWWRLLQPDGTMVFGIETQLAWRRRRIEERETEQRYADGYHRNQTARPPPQVTDYASIDEWKEKLESTLDLISTARTLAFKHLTKTADRFRLDTASTIRLEEALTTAQAEIAAILSSAAISESRHSFLRLVVDNDK